MNNRKPVIFGLKGDSVSTEEAAFFSAERPAGYILFARNCVDPDQLRRLTDALRAIHADYTPLILIDQEGGRVARLKPPHWRATPPAGYFAALAGHDLETATRLTYLNARLIAAELNAAGINTDCAPLADLPSPSCHAIIGDRAYGDTAEQVAVLGRAMADGLIDGGVLPVLKHLPGHGRAEADSHEHLPVVAATLETLRETDFAPFKALSDLPLGMTAHIVYKAIDPQPATLSSTVLKAVREEIGFGGVLMTDDLSMKALQGDFGILACQAIGAGCDLILHCNGEMAEMKAIANALAPASAALSSRLDELVAGLAKAANDIAAIESEYRELASRHEKAA